MIDETFSRLEQQIRLAELSDPARSELIELLASLKSEVGELNKKDPAEAKSLASFADHSIRLAQESSVPAKTPPTFEDSVQEFEIKHPQLVERVNRVCVILSNMGI
jgi:hypothetical protein